MGNQVSGFIFIACLLLSLTISLSADLAVANPTPQRSYITITQSGDIEPPTDLIMHEGNVYRLTANVTLYAVKIQCSNIVFDGFGYFILGAEDEWSHPKWWAGNSGLLLDNVTGVVVQNVKVLRFYQGVTLQGCVNCSVHQVVTQNINLLQSNNNTISQNNVIDTSIPSVIQESSGNLIYKNNFTLVGAAGANFWDNGAVGNYWSDYAGIDSNGDGIGDTPYVVDSPNNIDHYPMMESVIINEPQTVLSTPQIEPSVDTSSLNSTVIVILVASVVIVVCVGVFAIVKLKKRKMT